MSRKIKETNCTDNDLRRMMLALGINQDVKVDELKVAYHQQIKLHHTDKGGTVEKTMELTRAHRILKTCLDDGIQLPDPRYFGKEGETTTSATYERTSYRPAYQGQQRPPSWFDEEQEFEAFVSRHRRKKKGEGNGKSDGWGNAEFKDDMKNEFGETSGRFAKDFRRGNRFRGFAQSKHKKKDNYFPDDDDEEEEVPRLDLSKKSFANNYKYTNADLSDYNDPYERGGPSSSDHCRIVRGGLALLKDFNSANAVSEFADYEFGCHFDEIEFYTNPVWAPVLDKLQNNEESLMNLTEKLRTIVHLDWAMSREFQADVKIRAVRLIRIGESGDDSLYKFSLPASTFDETIYFSSGIHVDVRSSVDENNCAAAIVDSVMDTTIVLFFLDPGRIRGVLSNSQLVDLSVNASAFVFRSMLRSIDFIRQFRMDSIVYPTLEFSQTFESFEERRKDKIRQLNFLEGDGYNDYQKSAVYSIVEKVHRPYPFLLFGPPGTGKTVTLIEAIRQLTIQSTNNRILVCTPSRMAADNFAETLLEKKFIDPKYVFRMHSMSTSAIGRNRKLDPISYMPKEGRGRFFGIPNRLNIRVFRVIISTLSTSSYLISAGGLRGHFTHIFVDEAGQATEADTWIPIGGLLDTKKTSLILAGDPRQLGPVVNVEFLKSYGYGLSMLKRLIYSKAYEESDDRTMVVLKQTYRSHFRILRPCSYLFYNNMLVANEEDDMLYKLCEWEGLPTKGFPIVFHSSVGSDEEPGSNKSFSNSFEAERVVYYVNKLLETTSVKESDIGIISPYKNQVLKLRMMLSKRPTLTIDSVEGFQGSERERLNTSISRAKSLLIVIGDENLLRSHLSWQKFIYYCRYHGGYLDNKGKPSDEIVPLVYEN